MLEFMDNFHNVQLSISVLNLEMCHVHGEYVCNAY